MVVMRVATGVGGGDTVATIVANLAVPARGDAVTKQALLATVATALHRGSRCQKCQNPEGSLETRTNGCSASFFDAVLATKQAHGEQLEIDGKNYTRGMDGALRRRVLDFVIEEHPWDALLPSLGADLVRTSAFFVFVKRAQIVGICRRGYGSEEL